MARVNVGVPPRVLSDQHLLAESVEITMITGSLKKDSYIIKGEVPKQFCLGKGHINFFKNKLKYLSRRLDEVNSELTKRGFQPTTQLNQINWPKSYWNDWKPKRNDSQIVRERISDRLKNPLKAKSDFHKFNRVCIEDSEDFSNKMLNSELYFV